MENRTGQVLAGDAPASGVVISDGVVLTVTGTDGRYSLPPREGAADALVWMRVPAGHRAAGPWFVHGDRDALFHLEPDPEQADAFSFVFFTDIHLLKDAPEQPFRTVLDDIAALVPAPGFQVSGGDVELQTGMGEAYAALLDGHPIPTRHVVGNHDLLIHQARPEAAFEELFGPARCSWQYGRYHFATLRGMVPNPEKAGWRSVEGEFTEEELRWLEADLRLAEGKPVILFTHIPPVSTFARRRGALPGAEPAWEVRDTDRFLELCGRFNVRLVLSGHFHENERTSFNGTELQATGAVCGHWWEQGGRPALNLDGSPKGFRVVYVDGEACHSVYHSTGAGPGRQLRIVGPKAGARVRGRFGIGVNVFDGDARTRVEYRIGLRAWEEMRFAPQRRSPTVFGSAHFWTAWGPADLPRGTHQLSVRATFADGAAYMEAVTFWVEAVT
ncbi:MAG TPA: calcineurin-like phosphoesterase family protein [Armatimonadota bacterium]|nr:calcineurin-like phosphoesterase family protein [Armatimonadota bacterium]